jgi:hypothetical protein
MGRSCLEGEESSRRGRRLPRSLRTPKKPGQLPENPTKLTCES